MNIGSIPAKTRISVARYQKMVAAGVLTGDDRIELIEGEMIDMAPIGSKHAAITARLTKLFILAAGDDAILSPGGPVNLGDFSEPQPDLLLLRQRADYYSGKIPEAADVLLIIEVSDTTLRYDQTVKWALYARYGISEYWVVDVEARLIQVHRDPKESGYTQSLVFAQADTLSPLHIPDVRVSVRSLFE